MVGSNRQMAGFTQGSNHIEIERGWFDHQYVRSFLLIELRLHQRIARIGRIHLVAAFVAKSEM
jgi:hypothetical protein